MTEPGGEKKIVVSDESTQYSLRYAQARDLLSATCQLEYAKAPKTTQEGYHSFETHITMCSQVLEKSWNTITTLSTQDAERIIAQAKKFLKTVAEPTPKYSEVPEKVLELHAGEKPAFSFTENDRVLMSFVMMFHDVGRTLVGEDELGNGMYRKKAEHEERIVAHIFEHFIHDSAKYGRVVAKLAELYPELFDVDHIEQTHQMVEYLILSTFYLPSPEYDEKKERILKNFPNEIQEKLKFLGSLSLAIDIGSMQVLDAPQNQLAFLGLMDEYSIDDPEFKDQFIPGTIREWVFGWTDKTLGFALICDELMHPEEQTSAKRHERFRGRRFSRSIRRQFLKFLEKRVDSHGKPYDIDGNITWGDLKKEKDAFMQHLKEKNNLSARKRPSLQGILE